MRNKLLDIYGHVENQGLGNDPLALAARAALIIDDAWTDDKTGDSPVNIIKAASDILHSLRRGDSPITFRADGSVWEVLGQTPNKHGLVKCRVITYADYGHVGYFTPRSIMTKIAVPA